MKKARFYIYDDSATTGKPYIDHNGQNTGIYENRELFTTEKKAEKRAKSLSTARNWYSIKFKNMNKHYVMKTEKQAIAKAKAELRKEMGRRLFSLVFVKNKNSYCTCGSTIGKSVATWNAIKFYSKTVAVCENCYNDWQD